MLLHYAKKKPNRVYRYYVSAPLMRGDNTNPATVSRVNAAVLERLISVAFNNGKPVHANKPPSIDRSRVRKVIVYKTKVVLVATNDAGTQQSTIRIEAQLEKPSHRRHILNSGGKNNRNESLIKAVAQAHA